MRKMTRRVLIVAYHFPPCGGGSAVHRVTSFARHLRRHGWEPIVLAPSESAYQSLGSELPQDLASELLVFRTRAFDATRHFAIRGRYLRLLALPDPWSSWLPSATLQGLRLIRHFRPAALWSTYPFSTAHLIGLTLQRFSKLPWVADFRDPMTDEIDPVDPVQRNLFARIERATIKHSTFSTFTAPSALEMYRSRYADEDPAKFRLIENGYDEAPFAEIGPRATKKGAPFSIVHTGSVFENDRNPEKLFEAISLLVRDRTIAPGSVRFVFRGALDYEPTAREVIDRLDIGEYVSFQAAVPYRDAITEMLEADALLVLQGQSCNRNIPAKLYECIRARRPVIALTHRDGDTAALLRRAGIDTIADLDSTAEIAALLRRFLSRDDTIAGTATDAFIHDSERSARAGCLAALLDEAHGRIRETR